MSRRRGWTADGLQPTADG